MNHADVPVALIKLVFENIYFYSFKKNEKQYHSGSQNESENE